MSRQAAPICSRTVAAEPQKNIPMSTAVSRVMSPVIWALAFAMPFMDSSEE